MQHPYEARRVPLLREISRREIALIRWRLHADVTRLAIHEVQTQCFTRVIHVEIETPPLINSRFFAMEAVLVFTTT